MISNRFDFWANVGIVAWCFVLATWVAITRWHSWDSSATWAVGIFALSGASGAAVMLWREWRTSR